jgi:hypothetical protein
MIQPQWNRINSALPSKTKQRTERLPKRPGNFKLRSNSSNALNKSDDDFANQMKLEPEFLSQNYNSNKDSQNHDSDFSQRPQSMTNAVKLAICEKRGKYLNGNTLSNTQGIHLLPSTNKVYRNTKRVEFCRRMHMMDRPIVIIHFEGIIGNFHKERIWSEKNFKLITRGCAINGLRMFWTYFQVVIFIRKNLKKNIAKIKDWLKLKGVSFDAIYCTKYPHDAIEEDYAQIYNDFGIASSKQIAKRIIVINSVDIDSMNIESNSELEKTIFDKQNVGVIFGLPYTISVHTSTSPVPSSKPKSLLDQPLTLLLPSLLHSRADTKVGVSDSDLSMISLFKILISIAFLSLKEYSENFKYSNLQFLKESDVKLHRQFLGLDLTNVCHRSNSWDALLKDNKLSSNGWRIERYPTNSGNRCDEEVSTTILSESNPKRITQKESFEGSQDDEGNESCESAHTVGDRKEIGIIKNSKAHNKGITQKTLNEASLSKVNWMIGFEEASSKKLFDCLWLWTKKVSDIVVKRNKNTVRLQKLKQARDQKIEEMLCDQEITEEEYNKNKSIQITTMVSGILKESGILGNPIQSMMARNIRHFETVRRQHRAAILEQKGKIECKWEWNSNNSGNVEKTDGLQPNKDSCECAKQNKYDAYLSVIQVGRFKHINNPILAFGFTQNSKQLFWKVEKDREEIVNEEDFDLLKWFFGSKNINI